MRHPGLEPAIRATPTSQEIRPFPRRSWLPLNGITLREGVYVGLSGPSFETPADLRFLRLAGADSVGMSTVPEVTVARHSGMRVLGLSGISNKANLDGDTPTSHEEVLGAGQVIFPKIEKILRSVIRAM